MLLPNDCFRVNPEGNKAPSYIQAMAKDKTVFTCTECGRCQQACPAWVPLVESGDYLDFTVADPIIRDCLIKLLDQSDDIDTVLLACTHYPLLYPRIRAMLPPDISVVSQGEIVADSLSAYLQRHPEMETRLSKGASLEFCTTGDPESFKHAAGVFWGEGVDMVERVEVG